MKPLPPVKKSKLLNVKKIRRLAKELREFDEKELVLARLKAMSDDLMISIG